MRLTASEAAMDRGPAPDGRSGLRLASVGENMNNLGLTGALMGDTCTFVHS